MGGKTTAKTSLDESQICETLESVLHDSKVTPQQKKVKKWLQSNQSRAEIGALVSNYGLPHVSRVATAVLQRKVAGPSKSLTAPVRATEGAMSDPKTGDPDFKDERGSADSDQQRTSAEAPLSTETWAGDKVGSDRVNESKSDDN